jgi:1A family penicillin-binding protein
MLAIALTVFCLGVFIIWATNLKIPTLDSFSGRQVVESTRIYDKTGQVLLYDVNQNTKRTVVPFENISLNLKNSTVAIEDHSFYQHGGVDYTSFLRAFLADVATLSFSQGGSTITQQVVKNALLSNQKSIARKLKEFVLATKLEKILSKDEILNIYLNEIPFGGANYGVEEASQTFFGKHASGVTLSEAAYMAALIQAPSFYSPYGPNKDKLETRKNLVLEEMLKNKFISQKDYDAGKKEHVTFKPLEGKGIKSPHFVFYVISQLEQKYGEDAVQNGGLKVTTTLDWNLEEAGEQIADRYAISNKTNFNASNDAFVAIDPKTGQILAMIGSHNYFDTTDIDGNFNIATAHRQPGSTFKPFVYAAAFNKGYTPDTMLFDIPTQFSTNCAPDNLTSDNGCYAPVDYDGQYRGPMTLRNALAQSINIPSVEVLYLAGIKNSIQTAQAMGIGSLGNADQYGLTLVLGGGEVSLLDMTSAYGVFATGGIRHPYTSILKIEDKSGNVLEEYQNNEQNVLQSDTAQKISDILSDNAARTPSYGANSVLYYSDRDVAVKTGTTNDYKDAWIIGYAPNIVLGAWAGNNDNTPMSKKVAGLIVAPMWRAFMDKIVAALPPEQFTKPTVEDSFDLKPVLRGKWQGGISHLIDTVSGQNATVFTPKESTTELLSGGIHSILYWLNKDDPRGPKPADPNTDAQFKYWEYALNRYLLEKGIGQPADPILPSGTDTVHTQNSQPKISISFPIDGSTIPGDQVTNISINYSGQFSPREVDYFINGNLVGKSNGSPFSFSFIPNSLSFITENNTLKVVLYDSVINSASAESRFTISARR